MYKSNIGFALVGSLLSIVFFIAVNLLTSPGYIWWIYPAFVLLMWPMSVYYWNKRKQQQYAVFASTMIIVLIVVINVLHSPAYVWFWYAVYPVIWWPIALYVGRKIRTLGFALLGSGSTILYYTLLNVLLSPGYPWAIYPAYALLWWPLAIYFARKKDYFGFSLAGSFLSIIFFILVNAVSSPQVIWAVYPIFAVLWWPLTMYFYHYKKNKLRALYHSKG